MESISYADGINGTYSYDALNRLKELIWSNGTNQVRCFEYNHFANGMRRSVAEYDSSDTLVAEYIWTYDNLDRLTQEQYDNTLGGSDFTDGYVYDLVGNRLDKEIIVGSDYDIAYIYNDLDQLVSETSNSQTTSYLYDENGSLTKRVYGTDLQNDPADVYGYDLQGRLCSLTPVSGPVVNYSYDYLGNRVGKDISGGQSIVYLNDLYNPTGYAQVLEESNGSTLRSYILGSDVIASGSDSALDSVIYYVYDGHGSVRYNADYYGSLSNLYSYDAYGNAFGFTPSDGLYYTGEFYDTDLDWYYLRARWYEPLTGRFNTFDTFSGNLYDPQSLHKYIYCHNDSINCIDPSGQFTIPGITLANSIALKIRTKTTATGGAAYEFARRIAVNAQYYYYRVGYEVQRISQGGVWSNDLRRNLSKVTGDMPGSHAHHVLPRAFETWFNSIGIKNINDPLYGMWVEKSWHLSRSYAYNAAWYDFKTVHPEATVQQILTFAKEVSAEIMQCPTFIP